MAASRDRTSACDFPEITEDRRDALRFPGRTRIVVATVTLLLLLWLWIFSQLGEFGRGPSGGTFGGDFAVFMGGAETLAAGNNPYEVNLLCLPLVILLGCIVVKDRARLGTASAS